MRITILGCGEAFDETLPNTAMLVEWDEAAMLLDCGYSVPPRVWQALPNAGAIGLIYISHAHADHYFGLPALLGRMWEEGRRRPLQMVAGEFTLGQVREALEYGYRGLPERYQFPLEYVTAEPGRTLEIAGARFRFAPTGHPAPNLAVRIEQGGRAFCYSGDGAVTPASRALFAGADYLAQEAFSFDPSPVHADIGAALAMAETEGIGEVGLVHLSRLVRRPQADRVRAALSEAPRGRLPEPGETIDL